MSNTNCPAINSLISDADFDGWTAQAAEASAELAKLQEAASLLREVWEAKKAEDDYSFSEIAAYPDKKVEDGVRQKWLADLEVIARRQSVVNEKIRNWIKA
jgi:hypothetical protein